MEKKLKQAIKEAVIKAGLMTSIDLQDIVIEMPKDNKNGDYASNIAMQLTKQLKKNPRELAALIIENLDLVEYDIQKCEMAGPGFLNFFMIQEALTKQLLLIVEEKNNYGKQEQKGIRYNVEFVSANPTGEIHLGTARGAVHGDCISRLLEAAGYTVTREYYVNDAGSQINNLALSIKSRYNELYQIERPIPEDGYMGDDVVEIAKQLQIIVGDQYKEDDSDEALLFFREEGVRLELERISNVLKESRIEFDVWSSELEIRRKQGPERVIEALGEKGFVYESEGAIWFKSTEFGDDKDRVLVKSDGTYTYLTPDIAYHADKLERGHDFLVDVLGADHHGYIARMKAALIALGYQSNQLEIEVVQVVRFMQDGQEMKMSKRTGNALTMREFIAEVGVDAMRYYYAAKAAATQFDFDMDLATSRSQENPVYYVQYAHARMASILVKAAETNITVSAKTDCLVHPKEIELTKHLCDFGNMIVDAASTRMPHKVTNYTQKLAQLFHSFYNECHVIDVEKQELSAQRLLLVIASKIVIKNALELIGVDAPEQM